MRSRSPQLPRKNCIIINLTQFWGIRCDHQVFNEPLLRARLAAIPRVLLCRVVVRLPSQRVVVVGGELGVGHRHVVAKVLFKFCLNFVFFSCGKRCFLSRSNPLCTACTPLVPCPGRRKPCSRSRSLSLFFKKIIQIGNIYLGKRAILPSVSTSQIGSSCLNVSSSAYVGWVQLQVCWK